MSARLFRTIRATVLSFNKTVFLSAAVFVAVLFLHAASAHAALSKSDLDATFASYINNFEATSSITGGTVQQATANNDAVGLVFRVHIAVGSTPTNTNNERWGRVAQDPSNNMSFVIKLCSSDQPTECWITRVPSSNSTTVSADQHIISTRSAQNNPRDDQSVNISAFSSGSQNPIYKFNPTTGTSVEASGLTLPKGKSYVATLWYAANGSGSQAAGEYAKNNVPTSNPVTFGSNIVGGFSFFQIGTALPITIPEDGVSIQNQVANSTAALKTNATAVSNEDDNLPVCSFNPLTDNGTIMGCVAQVAYGLYTLVAWIAGIFGNLFDFFIGYSLSDASYRYTFAVTGWKLVRDISNVFFIIIMVWTGFTAVFQASTSTMRKVVPALIINALLINFSLFATRVVIDLSNITARMFYSQMIVCDKVNIDANGKCPAAQAKRGAGGYWPLSEKIVSSFNPQQIFNANILKVPNYTGSEGNSADFNAQNAGNVANITSKSDYAIYFMVVCIIAALIMGAVAIMFFKVAFLFLGRVVGLYLCMIFAPFAFLSRDIPMLGKIETLRWEDWKKELVTYALLAPIFIFFLYIVYGFLSSNFVAEIGFVDTKGDFFGTILSVVIPMLIIFGLLSAAQKAAERYAGDMGKRFQGWGEQLTGAAAGTAIGLASGGAAFLGRNTIGRGMRMWGNSKTGNKIMVDGKEVDETRGMRLASRSATSWSARQQNKLLRAGQTGSFNVGNAGLKIGGKEFTVRGSLNKGLGRFGVKPNNIVENLPYIGNKAGAGGILGVDKKRAEERQKEIEARLNFDHLSDDQAKAAWQQYKLARINASAEKDADKKWKDEKYINEEAAVKSALEETVRLKEDKTRLEANKNRLEAEEVTLKQQLTTASSAAESQRYERLIRENSDKQTANEQQLASAASASDSKASELEAIRKQTIERLSKDNAYKQSAAYAEAKKNANSDEKDRLEKYGNVKNGKMFTAAMRGEYAKDLRDKSFWLEDGKMRYIPGLITSATAAALAVALPGIGTIIGGAILANMAQGLSRRAGDIENKATKSMVDAYKKSVGKGSKEGRLTQEIEDLNKQITEAVEAHYGPTGLNAMPQGKADEWSEEVIETGIARKTFELEEKMRILNAAIATATNQTETITKKVEARVIKKQIDKLNGVLEKRQKAQGELEKAKEAAKNAEDNKKKDDK